MAVAKGWGDYLNSRAGNPWHDVAYWGILAGTCVVMLALNALTPLKEDDMALSMIPCGNLGEIWSSWLDHYLTTNGRFADVVATLFSAVLGKTAFNVCNALMFGAMAHLVTLLSTRRRSLTVLVLLLAFVGLCYPIPGETMLWLAGSCNYLWSITASLLLVWHVQRRHDRQLGWLETVLLFLGAFIAGNFNEAMSFGFLGGAILFCVVNRDKVNRRVVVALVGYAMGVLLIVASPGAWQRAAMGDVVINLGIGDLLMSRCNIFVDRVLRFIVPLLALLLGVGALILRGWKSVKHCVWAYVLLCQAVVMFALGIYHDRAYAPLATVSFILVAMALHRLWEGRGLLKLAVIVIGLALSAFSVMQAARAVMTYRKIEAGIIDEIRRAPRQAVLHERYIGVNRRFVKPMPFASAGFFWREDLYCAYFNKDNVQFVSDSIYNRYHSHRLLDGARVLPLTTDRPDIVDSLLAFEGQDYMVALIHVDSLPHTLQQADYYTSPHHSALTEQELDYRRRYGLPTQSISFGFYPLRYQGRLLLVFPLMDDRFERVVFPIDHEVPPCEVTITWQDTPAQP